jgi:hypothetical protein
VLVAAGCGAAPAPTGPRQGCGPDK